MNIGGRYIHVIEVQANISKACISEMNLKGMTPEKADLRKEK